MFHISFRARLFMRCCTGFVKELWMDTLFFVTGCLGLAETIDLFCQKDFLIFISGSIDPADYDLQKVYAVEKWLFAIDTLCLFGISFHVGGYYGDWFLLAVVMFTLILHWRVFKSPAFRRDKDPKGAGGKKRKKW